MISFDQTIQLLDRTVEVSSFNDTQQIRLLKQLIILFKYIHLYTDLNLGKNWWL